MKKTETIQARCTPEFKERLRQAAKHKNLSETAFILNSVDKEIKKCNITFNKLQVGGKLSQKEINQINKIKDLTKTKGRKNGETIWFGKEAKIALQINEKKEVIRGYLTNKKDI
jgi:hypothetical protein